MTVVHFSRYALSAITLAVHGIFMDCWTFDDFDEYASAVRHVNLEMLLQTLIQPRWMIRQLEVSGIQIQHGRQGSGDITQGQSSRDGYLLYVPLTHEQAQRANGRYLNANSVVIHEPGSEFCLSSNIDHEWCTVFIPTHQLFAAHELAGSKQSRAYMSQLPARVARDYRSLILRILAAVENCEALPDSLALTPAISELRRLTAGVVKGPPASHAMRVGRPRLAREEILRQALRLLDTPNRTQISIGALAASCRVSERTLRSVFQEYFGASPLQYHQLRRLHAIRDALRVADPHTTTVGDTLMSFGEWEFGRFARQYRNTFGELPSLTLRACTRSVRVSEHS